jgi:hypothetical protein
MLMMWGTSRNLGKKVDYRDTDKDEAREKVPKVKAERTPRCTNSPDFELA